MSGRRFHVRYTGCVPAGHAPESGFGTANQAPITFLYDFNRDKAVNATDQAIARTNPTTGFNDTNYINLPA